MAVVIDDVAQYLDDQGVGTVGTDIYKNILPPTPVAALCVIDTGGAEPDIYLPTKEPTFQVYIRSTTYSTGRSTLDDVRTALHRKMHSELVAGQTYFYFIFAISEGGYLGRDENGRHLFSINFRCRTR